MKYIVNPLFWVEKVCNEYVLIGTKQYKIGINAISVLTRGEVAVLNDIKRGIDFEVFYSTLNPAIKEPVIQNLNAILENLEKNGVISRID